MRKNGIEREYVQRAWNISAEKLRMFPFSFGDWFVLRNKLKNLDLKEPPIFIIGHWRSGTTHLHNLLTQDPQFGYISFFQSVAHPAFITGESLKFSIGKRVSSGKRPMDNMYVSLNTPHEEEFALMNMSFYHGLLNFPQKARHYFKTYVSFENTSRKLKEKWKKAYLQILKKITYVNGGKRLVLKNPPNTARIETLLEIFPDAKFIHIYRNPYVVYSSTLHMRQKLLSKTTLQKIDEKQLESDVLFFYEELMKKFFEAEKLIPPGNLLEIKYEDLEQNPCQELKRIYEGLNIPDFTLVQKSFIKYIDSNKKYKKNEHIINNEIVEKINKHWSFALDKWKYEPPQLLEMSKSK